MAPHIRVCVCVFTGIDPVNVLTASTYIIIYLYVRRTRDAERESIVLGHSWGCFVHSINLIRKKTKTHVHAICNLRANGNEYTRMTLKPTQRQADIPIVLLNANIDRTKMLIWFMPSIIMYVPTTTTERVQKVCKMFGSSKVLQHTKPVLASWNGRQCGNECGKGALWVRGKWSKNLAEIRKWTGLFNEVSRINAPRFTQPNSCAFGEAPSNYVDKMVRNFALSSPTEMVFAHFWRECSTTNERTATMMAATGSKEQRTTLVCLGFCGIFVRTTDKLYKLFGASKPKIHSSARGKEAEREKKRILVYLLVRVCVYVCSAYIDYFMWIECWFCFGRPSHRFCFHMLLIIEITKHKHANPNTHTHIRSHTFSPNSNQICVHIMEKNSTRFSHQAPQQTIIAQPVWNLFTYIYVRYNYYSWFYLTFHVRSSSFGLIFAGTKTITMNKRC